MRRRAIEEEICEKPGNGRKVLSFTDSRQGAARSASNLEYTVTTQNYQHIVPDVDPRVHNIERRRAEF